MEEEGERSIVCRLGFARLWLYLMGALRRGNKNTEAADNAQRGSFKRTRGFDKRDDCLRVCSAFGRSNPFKTGIASRSYRETSRAEYR